MPAVGVGNNVVLPGGISMLQSLFGGSFNPYDNANNSGLTNQLFGGGLMGSVPGTLNQAQQGGYVAPVDAAHAYALNGIFGGNGAGSAIDRYTTASKEFGPDAFKQWFQTGSPDGFYPSLQQSAGIRSAANYGGTTDPGAYGPMRTFAFLHDANMQNPNIQPLAQAQAGMNMWNANPSLRGPTAADYVNQTRGVLGPGPDLGQYQSTMRGALAPFTGPNPQNYVQQMQAALASPGANPDVIGQRGVAQTNDLSNQMIGGLNKNIDIATRQTLSRSMNDLQSQLAQMGLSSSGSGQAMGNDLVAQVLSDANRQKQANLYNLTNQTLGQRAAAIGQGTQVGAQGAMGQQGALSQILGQGLGGQAQNQLAQQAAMSGIVGQGFGAQAQNQLAQQQALTGAVGAGLGQQGAAGLQQLGAQNQALGQGYGNYAQQLLGGQGQYLQALLGTDQNSLARLAAADATQHTGFGDVSSIYQQGQNQYNQSLQNMLSLADYQRSVQQEQLNQQLQYGMLPINMLQQMVTGVQPAQPAPPRTSPWTAGLAQGIGQGVGAGVNTAIQGLNFG